jgi:hypothetical protein
VMMKWKPALRSSRVPASSTLDTDMA